METVETRQALPTLPARSFALRCTCCLETPEQTFECADGARCSSCAAVAVGAEVFGSWFGEDSEHQDLVAAIATAIEEGYEDDFRAVFTGAEARAYLAYEVKADRRAPKSGLAITPAEWRAYRLARTRKAIALLRAMQPVRIEGDHCPRCNGERCEPDDFRTDCFLCNGTGAAPCPGTDANGCVEGEGLIGESFVLASGARVCRFCVTQHSAPHSTHHCGADCGLASCKRDERPVPSVAECWDALVASMAADGRRAA